MKNSQCFTNILLIFQLCSFTFLLAQGNEKHRLKESPCSVYTFTAEDLQSGPYRDLFDVLNTLPGVNAFGDLADRPSLRGSDWREVSVIMDGMEMTDQITNWPNLRIPLNIIDTLQVYTGGFIAEYGNARGGLIVITTKTGGDKLSVNADVRYSPPGLKHFGPMAYGVDSPIVRPFVDESAGAFTGNAYFEGWNAYAFETLKPGDPHYGKPYENYALYLWRHRSLDNLNILRELQQSGVVNLDLNKVTDDDAVFEYGNTPDWTREFSLHGPIPFLKHASFSIFYKQEEMEYALQTQHDTYADRFTYINLSSNLGHGFSIKAGFFNLWQRGTNGRNEPTVNSDIATNAYRDIDDIHAMSPHSIWSAQRIISPVYQPQRYFLHLEYWHSTKTKFQLALLKSKSRYGQDSRWRDTKPLNNPYYPQIKHLHFGRIGTTAYADSIAVYDPNYKYWRDWTKIKIGNIWYDETPYGIDPTHWYDASQEFRMASSHYDFNNSKANNWLVLLKVSKKISNNISLNSGIKFNRPHIKIEYDRITPSYGAGYLFSGNTKPLYGHAYLNSTINYHKLLAELDVQYSFTQTDKMFTLNNNIEDKVNGPFSIYLTPGYTGELDNLNWKKYSFYRLNPRLFLTYSIHPSHSIYVNYGHYTEWPDIYNTYILEKINGQGNRIKTLGNPALEPPRTIAFEMGYTFLFLRHGELHMNGYIKKTYDDVVPISYVFSEYMNPSYESYKNAGEKKMKGLEASVEYQINSLLTSQIHYDYMKIDESITGQTVIYESGNTTDATSVVHGSTQPQPVFRFTAKLETPSEYGFYVLNTHPLGGFSMNFLYTWRKGETFQWQNKDISWRPFQNMDLRIAKYIAGYKKVKAEFYVNIFNLFNNKNMQTPKGYIYDNEGNLVDIEGSWSWAGKSSIYNWPWWQDEFTKYMNSLDIVGGDRPGDYPHDGKKSYIDMPGFTPWTFLEKRDVFVGFKFSYQF